MATDRFESLSGFVVVVVVLSLFALVSSSETAGRVDDHSPYERILRALQTCKHVGPLGMTTGRITNEQITSSSVQPPERDRDCTEGHARVFQADRRAWCSRYKSSSEWLQVDLGFVTKVTGIMTQGRCGTDEWVEAFSISHSVDSINWIYVEKDGVQRVFEGNSDSCSVKHSYLEQAIQTRYVKVHVSKFNKHPSLRVEFIGCQVCDSPLGLPPVGRMSASSEKPATDQDTCQAHHGFLITNKAWCPKRYNGKQWLQLDIGPPALVTALVTKGRGEEGKQHWVTKYSLSFSNDSFLWHHYEEDDFSGSTKIFQGNSDRSTEHVNHLARPIVARYFRFHPVEWHRGIAMRVGLLGCPHEGSCPDGFMRVNEDTPCVENLAFKKNLWVSSKDVQRKRHARHQWAKAVPLTPASPIVLGHPVDNSTQGEEEGQGEGGGSTPGVSSCVVLENYEVTRPIWLVDLKRKVKVSGVIIKTPVSVARNKEEEMDYRVYMHDLDKLVVYLDDHDAKGQITTPEVVCGSVRSTNDALFKPKIHVTCAQPIKARYVYIEAWGLEDRDGRLFTATLCDVGIY